jgi:hypothetical protein
MHQRTSQVLFAYWNDVRGERIAPRRFDVEPSQIGSVLAETFILECPEDAPADAAATFRLAGTKICENFGREFRGSGLLEMFGEAGRAVLSEQFAEVRRQGAVLVLQVRADIDERRSARFEVLLLPLIHTGTSISRILGAISAIDPPVWLGTERLPPLQLLSHEQIWPDGRPHAIVEKFREQPSLIPELSGARVVRVSRRSFRVLDGGLHKP